MGFETQDVERKVLSILRVLNESEESLGARVIAQRLKKYGVELGERAVRYHLKLTDEKGLTRLVGRRDGRLLTERGKDKGVVIVQRREVVDAAGVGEKLGPRTIFPHFLMHPVDVADDGFSPDDVFAVHRHLDPQDPVSGRMLRPQVQDERLLGVRAAGDVVCSDHALKSLRRGW